MNSWTYPISGNTYHFPEREGDASFTSETHYFTKSVGGYSPSGVLRSVALFIDGLAESGSVEAMMFYPEFRDQGETTWAAMISVYYDRPGTTTLRTGELQ